MKKEKRYRKYGSFTVLAALTAAAAMALSACGKQENSVEQQQTLPEYVYVPEYIELGEGENNSFYNAQIEQDSIYCINNSYDEATMTSKTELYRYTPSEGGEPAVVPVALKENTSVNGFSLDKEGNIYFCIYDYSETMSDESGMISGRTLLAKYDAQGSLLYEQDITDILNKNEENSYVSGMVADGEGRLYLYSTDLVRLFDSEGSYKGDIDNNDNWISGMGRGKDGKVYISYYDSNSGTGGTVLAELDFDGKKVGNTYTGFPENGGGSSLTAGIEKDFLINDRNKLLEYDMASQTTKEILTWLDSDINGQYVEGIGALEDGRIIAMINDWGTGETDIALLTKMKSSELPQKEQITIGTLYSNQNLQAAAVNFNKSSDKYHVNIQNYIDNNVSWTETTYEDAMTRLNNDITSGVNCPDILDLSQLNVKQLASKGVFENLMPYLEKSTVLKKDDFMQNILDSYTYDGVLVSIPSTFSLSTVIGKASDVGEEMGWTLEEMIAFAEEHEGAQLFNNASKSSIMHYCMTYNMDSFVDWSTGECSFDTPEFKQLLEFVNHFPDEIDWESDTRSEPAKIQAGDVLLSMAYISDVNNIQEYMAMFNEPITCIGYPTMDGDGGCMLNVNELYAITAGSSHKEGAWAFIEHYLENQSTDNIFSYGLPTRLSKFEEMIEKATAVEYVLDENGEPLLDENGEKIQAGGMSSISYGDWEYTYHTPTEEEAALLRQLVEAAKPVAAANDEISTIISEEAEAFYQGQKSADEVAKVIQSRAQIYVSENS